MGKKKGKGVRVENTEKKRKKGNIQIARIKEKGNFYKWRKGETKEREGKLKKERQKCREGRKNESVKEHHKFSKILRTVGRKKKKTIEKGKYMKKIEKGKCIDFLK